MTVERVVSSPSASSTTPARPAAGGGALAGAALTAVLAVAGGLLAAALVMSIDQPTPLPPPFPGLGLPSQNQDAETFTYLLVFAVVLPGTVALGARLERAIAAGPHGNVTAALSGGLAALLAAMVLALSGAHSAGLGTGVHALLAGTLVWWALAAGALRLAVRGRPSAALATAADRAGPVWVVAGVLTAAVLLTVTRLGQVRPLGLVAGAVVVGAAVVLGTRARVGFRLGLLLDAVVVAVVVLAIPDLAIFPIPAPDLDSALAVGIAQFHQDFLLGPANQVLHGGAMLVDTASQYGVGSIYALVAAFHIAPIGYGTLGLIDAALTSAWFALGYLTLRVARTPRGIAMLAIGLSVVALAFHLVYPVGYLIQDGPFRFGLPMAVVLALVVAARWPSHGRLARGVAAAFVGLSAVWSLEAFAYTAGVYVVMVGLEAWLRPAGARVRWLLREGALAVAWCVLAHVVLFVATLAATGHAPDWGLYLNYLKEFLTGGLGDLTYDVRPWNPGLAVAVGYLASAVGVVEILRRRGTIVEAERPLVTAIGGMTAYGILLLSYWVNRSLDHILVHISLPLVLTAALWVGLLVRRRLGVPVAFRRGALLAAGGTAVLAVGAAWPTLGSRFGDSMLAYAAPGGDSLRGAVQRLWHLGPVRSASAAGVALLERWMPGQAHSLVIAAPGVQSEILLRSDRADTLLLGDPLEASFVAPAERPRMQRELERLRRGDRILLDASGKRALVAIRAHPELDPLSRAVAKQIYSGPASASLLPRDVTPLQQWALRWIDQRFALRTIARDAQGFEVLQLGPRRGPG